MKYLLDLISGHKAGAPAGIYSVCSSHPLVIEASLLHAASIKAKVLIEATSNQVNQDGGYTGMVPAEFCQRVYEIADRLKFPRADILFGGDHLGPNCWQELGATQAMEKSIILIKQYVEAGFRKIHLDCSMSLKGDPVPLSDECVAERAAVLCGVSENAWLKVGGQKEKEEPPVYIVGSEVPVPGGAHENLDGLAVTTPERAAKTIDAHKSAFEQAGLASVWSRVIGLVVQPGVEFDNHKVIAYDPAKAAQLSQFIEKYPTLVYEAHSTDYQSSDNLEALVKDHFAILKVGPALTYAMREALWALDAIERQWIGAEASHLKQTVLKAMHDNPVHWQKYYRDEEGDIDLVLEYSLSDRIRYYWPEPMVEKAMETLMKNLDDNPPPLELINQYMPVQHQAILAGEIKEDAKSLIVHKISTILKHYSDACTEIEG